MLKVLIVEDDPMVQEINRRFVGQVSGFEVIGMKDSITKAQEFVQRNPVDLILLDVFLPEENGLDLLKWLRKMELGCDVILITADKSAEAIEEALRYGAVDYLIKPFLFERLKEALHQYQQRRMRLVAARVIEQTTLDQYILTGNKGEEGTREYSEELPKGLNQQTYQKVWEMCHSRREMSFTADEVAEGLGLARVTVRRYLEYMLKEGKLRLQMEYGKVGRPHHHYQLNDDATPMR